MKMNDKMALVGLEDEISSFRQHLLLRYFDTQVKQVLKIALFGINTERLSYLKERQWSGSLGF